MERGIISNLSAIILRSLKQSYDACKGGFRPPYAPLSGGRWPLRGRYSRFSSSEAPLFSMAPLTAFIGGARTDLLGNGQNLGPGLD